MTSMLMQIEERPNQATQQQMIQQLGHKNQILAKPTTPDTLPKPLPGILYSHMLGF
jgi:hypothetical protein